MEASGKETVEKKTHSSSLKEYERRNICLVPMIHVNELMTAFKQCMTT
jgi:hypothetical protein